MGASGKPETKLDHYHPDAVGPCDRCNDVDRTADAAHDIAKVEDASDPKWSDT